MKRFTAFCTGLVLFFFFSGCNTYVWQPIGKMIQGKWIVSPDPISTNGPTERWIFDSDGCLYITHTPGVTKPVDTLAFLTSSKNTSLTQCIEYSVQNRMPKDYVLTDRYFLGGDPDITGADVGKWLVVKLNDKEMYLSAEVENSEGQTIKGGIQKGFLKEADLDP